MRKITLLIVAFLGSIAMQAQVPCGQNQPTVDFAGGASITTGYPGGQAVANDFIVTSGTTVFSVETISASMLTPDDVDIASIDVSFYSDNGGAPGSQIGTTQSIVPTSQAVSFSGTLGDGSPIVLREIILDFSTPEVFVGSGTSTDVTYWVSLTPNPSTATGLLGWENVNSNTTPIIGASLAFISAAGGDEWVSSQNTDGSFSDGVFNISGTCFGEPLGVEENQAITEISLYPNPVQGQLNITLPSNVQLESATMFDLLGKATTMVVSENNTLNTASLASGVYILKLETNQGTLTKKVIKN